MVPFLTKPEVSKVDGKLFSELYEYVAFRTRRNRVGPGGKKKGSFGGADDVVVLSRKNVGSFEVATVRENAQATLNAWLEREGYRSIPSGTEALESIRYSCSALLGQNIENRSNVPCHVGRREAAKLS